MENKLEIHPANDNDLWDNEDEFIQTCHQNFLDGKYTSLFDYKNDID